MIHSSLPRMQGKLNNQGSINPFKLARRPYMINSLVSMEQFILLTKLNINQGLATVCLQSQEARSSYIILRELTWDNNYTTILNNKN